MTDPKKPAFYLRVSTAPQEFDSQLHALRECCRRKGWPVPGKATLFAEKISGAKAKRRELDRLLQACRDGHFDAIVCYKVDRIGRSMPHLVNLHAELKAIGIRVIGVADGVDTGIDTPQANAFRHMLATFAELQRETIVENTRAGLAAARAQGRVGGRRRKNDPAIARALKMRAKGKTLEEIKKATGLSVGYVSMLFNGKRSAPK